MLTKSGIIKAGHRIARLDEEEDKYIESIEILSQWRLAHMRPMQSLNMFVRNKSSKNLSFITAQRLKRLPTIVSKLRDNNIGCDLYSMQDIGGVRCIAFGINQLNKLFESIKKSKFRIRKIDKIYNYNDKPKETGYTGIHIIYISKTKNSSLEIPIELQLRTYLQHAWAMTVETLDVINKSPSGLKRGYINCQDGEFMKLCSVLFSKEENRTVVDEYKNVDPKIIVEKLSKIDNDNKITQKLKVFTIPPERFLHNKPKNGYYILKLNVQEGTVSGIHFDKKDYENAEKQYLAMEKSSINDVNTAIVLLSIDNFKSIKKAYPSYFLDTSAFLARLKKACEKYK